MKKTLFTAAIFTLVTAPALACEMPQSKPSIPDPTTAVTAQMVKVNNEVKAYVRATEEYLSCARLSSSEARKTEDELRSYADTFNQTIREFKKLNG
ncbi:hypothetical protein KO507_14425 [Gilvimarinus agarilyticus]|uniref:hypothetical protein n=1 Tax=unclassified Gilvimarinus TaxID=2642066 RepID=UPI001C07EF4C|nr:MULTISPECIES: hypothetical protein [unclassified Gilvimarinus]MBU2886962.1 hypothetical protein [Gilvimarinus agarilyticus]MDO6571622.1 hypothetical protein [Gilvimarinus sp. 2_MG-2023]MDO6745694.1 hypothetical protein [Gilvimarinus sp. 1_MG-2023]